MAKRKVLIVVNHLTVGGVQKSLISALNAIDYSENDVTLYLRKNRTTLLPFVNKNVNVIINKDSNHYYRSLTAIRIQLAIAIKLLFGKDTESLKEKLANCILEKRMGFEKKSYFEGSSFDVAISYVQGHTALFVSRCINAREKIVFYQGSVDELHKVHEIAFPIFDLFVVEHENISKMLCSWYDGIVKRVFVLDNYIDYLLIRQLAKDPSLRVKQEKTILCTCARFEYVKGIDIAVEAARILRDKGYDFIWYLVGDGTARTEIENLIEKYSLQDNIILTGILTNPYPYMAGADVYVQPSREEALSIAMLESQILCVPMVSTKTAGGLAMVEEGVNGSLADISPESLAEAIIGMIIDESARARIIENLSQIDYSEKETEYKNHWRDLLGKSVICR